MSDKRYQDADWLREQYLERGRSQADIAGELGCGRSTVSDWLHKHDIETREKASATPDARLKDADWLREQYVERTRSTADIAGKLECSKSTVSRWLRRHDIETRGKSTTADARLKDADWLREQYVGRERSTADIADELGCGSSSVRKWLHKHDIETREGRRAAPDARLKDADWLREQYVERGRTQADIADECGCVQGTVSRWLHRHDIETRGCGYSRVGENHPQWNGGRFPYGPGWNERKRQRVRERDGYECVRCGATQEEHKARYGERLHVHHLTKAREIDDAEERNSISNLVALCRDCHADWERVSAAGLRPQITTAGD